MARDYVTQAELEAALQALQVPGRFDTAERLVRQVAPGLHRILLDALASGGWNAADDAREIDRALAAGDAPGVRDALGSLLGEQTRLAMLVGVAVGMELARELDLDGGEPPLTISHHSDQEAQ